MKKGEKLRSRRIAVGMAGLAVVIVVGISLAVFTGQKREPTKLQEELAVNELIAEFSSGLWMDGTFPKRASERVLFQLEKKGKVSWELMF